MSPLSDPWFLGEGVRERGRFFVHNLRPGCFVVVDPIKKAKEKKRKEKKREEIQEGAFGPFH